MRLYAISVICLVGLLLAACSQPATNAGMQVKDAWARAAAMSDMQMDNGSDMSGSMQMGGSTSAAYMVLQNNGDEADRLVGVTSDAAEMAEMHITQTENDVASMKPVDSIDVPAHGETELKPGGLHIMLMNLKHELKAGDKIGLTLEFEKAGTVNVEAEVRAP